MARVKYIEEESTDNPVIKESFERMRKKRGKVTNIYKALAHKPSILGTIGPFVAAVQQPDELDAKLKERIILRVSKINRSAYCCHAHEQISAKMGFTKDEIDEMNNPGEAKLSDADKAALRYAEALTVNPEISRSTGASLR
jgi:AhpD family alkylhydroperoxidase